VTEIPTTGSRGQPLKMAQYLANGKRLAVAVNAYRAAKGEASAEGAPLTQNSTPVDKCNKPKSYRLPPLATPTPIPGFPFAESIPDQVPDYGTIGRAKRVRRGAPALDPIGPPELRKASQ
jgi:hypothetical protein